MSPRLAALFTEYADCHRHPMNRLTHKIAIPLIVFHIIAMLDWVPLFSVNGHTITLAIPAYLAAITWYFSMSPRLGVAMAVLFGACFPLAWITPGPVVIAIAVLGWIVQLLGHSVWEKKQPAFLTNLLQALVGPAFFVAPLVGLSNPRGRA